MCDNDRLSGIQSLVVLVRKRVGQVLTERQSPIPDQGWSETCALPREHQDGRTRDSWRRDLTAVPRRRYASRRLRAAWAVAG